MIGRLRGRIAGKQPPELLLDVQGVGYELEVPMSSFYDLPELGAEVSLHTHLSIREDAHALYGFLTELERSLFRSLIRISGVGPKLALALLSGISPDDFIRCVENGDSATLTRLPGVGKKTAERLVVEMRDRVKGLGVPATVTAPSRARLETADDPIGDAVSALVALGYKPNEAGRLARDVAEDGLGSEEIIRRALQKALR